MKFIYRNVHHVMELLDKVSIQDESLEINIIHLYQGITLNHKIKNIKDDFP